MSAPIGGMITFACMLLLPVCQASPPSSEAQPQAAADNPMEDDSGTGQSGDETLSTHALDPMTINAPLFKIPRSPLEKLKLDLHFALNIDFGAPAIGGAFVLTPGRLIKSRLIG